MDDATKRLHTAHDRFSKFTLSHKVVAINILKTTIPLEIQNSIDFETLEPYPTEAIKANLSSKYLDVAYSAKLKGKKESCYFILHFEQETDPKPDLPLRTIEYKVQLIRNYLRQHPGHSWPPIYTIVLHNGTEPYKYPTKLADLFGNQEFADMTFMNLFELVDLPTVSNELLAENIWVSSSLGLLKNIGSANLADYVRGSIKQHAAKLEKEAGIDYIISMCKYVLIVPLTPV